MNWVCILRGINVSGYNKIPMPALKAMFGKLGFGNVSTYIQSGNVMFEDGKGLATDELVKMISAGIAEQFGFTVPVIVRTGEEMERIAAGNPFLKEDGIDAEKLHVTFLAETPSPAALEAISKYDYSPDRFIIAGREVYLYCPGGYGNTRLSNSFFESKLKVTATTRNWRTVLRLRMYV